MKMVRPTTQWLWAWFIASSLALAAKSIDSSTNPRRPLPVQRTELLEAVFQAPKLHLELLDLPVGRGQWAVHLAVSAVCSTR